ncbi:MAG: hypothetical protein ACD_4C00108G0002 [uncultured bacterium (gcode 4)]|uniref:Uncharacterized protein n=1 Tax=uncultured bacterium (gcode 4) TaxID=1234023 RepID=K2FVG1_9BACT|nr:MAG: hypothetical protein ACD_4C00108G0002 [uncultured bacterium (gcode 4)]
MTNSVNWYPTEDQNKKNIKLRHLKFCWTSRIIFLNYRKCIENKGLEYYYKLYLAKFEQQEENWKKTKKLSFETFSSDKYVDKVISMYCNYFSDTNSDYKEMGILEKIDFVYWDLIDDAEKIWSDVIMNKLN